MCEDDLYIGKILWKWIENFVSERVGGNIDSVCWIHMWRNYVLVCALWFHELQETVQERSWWEYNDILSMNYLWKIQMDKCSMQLDRLVLSLEERSRIKVWFWAILYKWAYQRRGYRGTQEVAFRDGPWAPLTFNGWEKEAKYKGAWKGVARWARRKPAEKSGMVSTQMQPQSRGF